MDVKVTIESWIHALDKNAKQLTEWHIDNLATIIESFKTQLNCYDKSYTSYGKEQHKQELIKIYGNYRISNATMKLELESFLYCQNLATFMETIIAHV